MAWVSLGLCPCRTEGPEPHLAGLVWPLGILCQMLPCWAGLEFLHVELFALVVLFLVEVCSCVAFPEVNETSCVSTDKWLLSPWLEFSYRPLNPLVWINCALLLCKKLESSCWSKVTVFLMQPLIRKTWKINNCYKSMLTYKWILSLRKSISGTVLARFVRSNSGLSFYLLLRSIPCFGGCSLEGCHPLLKVQQK